MAFLRFIVEHIVTDVATLSSLASIESGASCPLTSLSDWFQAKGSRFESACSNRIVGSSTLLTRQAWAGLDNTLGCGPEAMSEPPEHRRVATIRPGGARRWLGRAPSNPVFPGARRDGSELGLRGPPYSEDDTGAAEWAVGSRR